MIYNTYFHEDIKKSLELKKKLEKQVQYILLYLKEHSPKNNNWYYNDGFVKVDVTLNEYDEYIKFIENMVQCSYTYTATTDKVTLMISLTTLNKKLDKVKKEI